jgi:hypothetical protein
MHLGKVRNRKTVFFIQFFEPISPFFRKILKAYSKFFTQFRQILDYWVE